MIMMQLVMAIPQYEIVDISHFRPRFQNTLGTNTQNQD